MREDGVQEGVLEKGAEAGPRSSRKGWRGGGEGDMAGEMGLPNLRGLESGLESDLLGHSPGGLTRPGPVTPLGL